MGEEVDQQEFSREDRTRYREKVRRCLDAAMDGGVTVKRTEIIERQKKCRARLLHRLPLPQHRLDHTHLRELRKQGYDKPVVGEDWFFNLNLIADTVFEMREVPTPVGAVRRGGPIQGGRHDRDAAFGMERVTFREGVDGKLAGPVAILDGDAREEVGQGGLPR